VPLEWSSIQSQTLIPVPRTLLSHVRSYFAGQLAEDLHQEGEDGLVEYFEVLFFTFVFYQVAFGPGPF